MAGTKRKTRKRRITIIELMLEEKGVKPSDIAKAVSVVEPTVFNTLDRVCHNLKVQEYIAGFLESDPFELWGTDYQPFHKMHHETVYPIYIPKGNMLKSPVQMKLREQGIKLRHIVQATSASINVVFNVLHNKSHNKRVQDHIAVLLNTTPEELFGENSNVLFRTKKTEYRADGHKPDLVRKAAIKAALKSRGITQTRIAESLNFSRQMVSLVIRGEYRHERTQNRIAEILGKDPARLWGTDYAPFCKKQLQAIRNNQPLSMIG
jgi:lambda repressor-like predicted transcriptional regulator